jgi:hypothetical protein
VNSIQQEYLVAMGIDTYYPRWSLPFAAESPEYPCITDEVIDAVPAQEFEHIVDHPETPQTNNLLLDVLNNIEKQTKVPEVKSTEAKERAVEVKAPSVQPFSLSLWRPMANFLVIADRTTDALPTELLMQNILRFYMNNHSLKVDEEILRWPAVHTSPLALTEDNARTELQTWLSVQHELQPINQLWFFGESWKYFTQHQNQKELDGNCFVIGIDAVQNLQATCFRGLHWILQNPQLKTGLLGLM